MTRLRDIERKSVSNEGDQARAKSEFERQIRNL